MENNLNVVTGAYGYIGKYITRILLEKGFRVRTLTGHPDRPNEFGNKVEAVPFNFDRFSKLVENLKGVNTVFNTYWVRFDHGNTTYGQAVANTQNLIRASKEAGVKRFVHVSITKPDKNSPFPYFSGKAIMEETLINSGLSYAIVRPTVLFGREDILINNIAWLLKRFPVFGVLGKGDYRIQPVYVGDAAALAVKLAMSNENAIVDAVGPETFAFRDLVALIRKTVGSKSLILNIPPPIVFLLGKFLGAFLGDVLLTKQEIGGLMAGLLVSENPPTCPTRFSDWIKANADDLGKKYASEIARHYK